MTYQQLEVIRLRALELGLVCEWLGEREEDEAWLRLADGYATTVCWFPGRRPILAVQTHAHDPLELAHAALELVALYQAITAGLVPNVADAPSPSAQRLFEAMLGVPEVAP